MSIEMRQDSNRNMYQVWAQEQPASCAVASIWMARSQARQKSFAEEEWDLAWRIYRHTVEGMPLAFSRAPYGPVCIDPPNLANDQATFYDMFRVHGTYAGQVAQALRTEGLNATFVPNASGLPLTNTTQAQTLNLAKVSTSTPVIVMLGWYSLVNGQPDKRNGGHFVVAANVIGNRIVYLDPWGGELYELANDGRYRGRGDLLEELIYVSARR